MNMEENGILVSPRARDVCEIPKIPLMDYVFKTLRAKMPLLRGKLWLEAVDCGENIKFEDVENLTKQYASALAGLSFKKGDILYYCTFDVNHLYLIRLAVWYLGGSTTGWLPGETKESHIRSLKQTPPKIVLIDNETGKEICEALAELNMSVQLLSFGNFNDAISVQQLLANNSGALFQEKVEIDPMKDVMFFASTSGSTGPPKTIPHTSYSVISLLQHYPMIFGEKTFQYGVNIGVLSVTVSLCTLMYGITHLCAAKFDNNLFIDWILKYKPTSILIYSFLSNWLARTIQTMKIDLCFLKLIAIGASVLDSETINILSTVLPHHVKIVQIYGMSENPVISSTFFTDCKYPKIFKDKNGEEYTTSGVLVPYVQAKIIDFANGRILAPYERGEILMRSPQTFLGYLKPETLDINLNTFDSAGWFKTEDIGFYDEDYNIYIVDRTGSVFIFRGGLIAPSEIESCLGKHEVVLSCAVVPIPDKDNDNLARGYVVLRPGKKGTVTEKDLVDYVAKNMTNVYKQLHGGVRFINEIPLNKSGKIDRPALKKISMSAENGK